ncbi:succinylglutamate desuccinylase/aspartoacylase domain-containing protein [Halostagnicola kamekurae]|uniref:succinylglutamate desuccinylase/aspartoacylase domain-containing protein n=1 Tax=Halostagnicola kamekurae TaxID=619731 RepID=UPI001FE7E1A3|nr:succinylglutamate desuccinylase/aspartoacylase family protein [Halostagnicola kamekurae]
MTATASFALIGVAGANDGSESDSSRESYQILEGTDHETTVYRTTASADGPTVVVVGGMHGNEVGGYEAASAIAEWDIDAGTLVTIPRANAEAVELGTRSGDDGIDLNRQFPQGQEPTTDVARAIWNVLENHDPDIVIDLHESIGIYAGGPVDGVGQAIFHSDGAETATDADQAADTVSQNLVDEPALEFTTDTFAGPETEPSGLLVHKAARDLDAQSFLIETLSRGPALETRVQWHTRLVTDLVEEGLFEAETTPEDSSDETADGSSDETAGDADDSSDETTGAGSDGSSDETANDSDDEVIEQCPAGDA